MPSFTYKAKHGPEKIIEGTIDADNLDSAIVKVMKLGYTPLDVKEGVRRSIVSGKNIKPKTSFFKKVKPSDVNMFTRQLCDFVEAGVPILRGIGIILAQTKSENLKNIVAQIHAVVKDGGALSDALADHRDVFSNLYVNMVRSGEMGGNLDVVLRRLADFSEKDLETQSKVKSSLAYPLFILGVGVLTIFVLVSFVIPRLSVVFEDLGESLPVPTIILLNVSHFLKDFWWLIVIFVFLVMVYLRSFAQTSKGRLWIDTQKLKIPVFKKFLLDVEIGRFARTLGTLLESGVVIVPALKSVLEVLDNEVLRQEIFKVTEDVANGVSLTAALGNCPNFPPMAVQMVAVGEETGQLEKSLYKLADSYERQADQSVKVVLSLLGPIALVLIVMTVGFLVMSMLLPIFKMNLIIK